MKFIDFLSRELIQPWHDHFVEALTQRTRPERHGDLPKWLDTLASLPAATPSTIDLNQSAIQIGSKNDLSEAQQTSLYAALQNLMPWRKGPYQLFDTDIDTEWRSDWKWQRLSPHISNLTDRNILDVGCGNGYHCWRMLGEGAKYVLGIDPSMLFQIQHRAVQHFAKQPNFDLLPLGIEDMPVDMPIFDTVLSMGVLYHRRNPINHLIELRNLLADDGELVLETLIVDAEIIKGHKEFDSGTLTPSGRYAMMRNVWSIMTIPRILQLLHEAGFDQAVCVDQNVTSLDEQRSTEWMQFQSLTDFLDPEDINKTIEGYPAPKRGTFIAKKLC